MATFLTFNTSLQNAAPLDTVIPQETPTEKMPLQNNWVIWEQVQQQDMKMTSYSENTHELARFDTVQSFWHIYGLIPQPSELLSQKRMVRQLADGESHIVDALMIFKDGIRPEWEDEANSSGGHLEYRLRPNIGGAQIDEYWNNLILGVVGGTIDPGDVITGVRLVDKLGVARGSPHIRLEVWYTRATQPAIDKLHQSVNSHMAAKIDGREGTVPHGQVKHHK
eukprot:GHVT01009718.1.p2 GENE.GHVT01009718.1~~GHVT01009718.1.p2  ORF type:complete len:223 (+),score=19.53 GHVT01009718.1:421-1089(+)